MDLLYIPEHKYVSKEELWRSFEVSTAVSDNIISLSWHSLKRAIIICVL